MYGKTVLLPSKNRRNLPLLKTKGIYVMMKLYEVTDPSFAQYGRVIGLDTASLIEAAKTVPMPADGGSAYVPTLPAFEALPIRETIANKYFGGAPAQIGYCWGHNDTMNAVEWHTCSEINAAVAGDLVLLLGDVRDIGADGKYDSAKLKAFVLRHGQAVEVYATTLHYCPINMKKEGFGCVVGLIAGTNTDIDFENDDPRLTAKNKWLLAHKDCADLMASGAVDGITGENIRLTF